MRNCHICAQALLQSTQRIAREIEELRELQRQVREAAARLLGERSPRPRPLYRRREREQIGRSTRLDKFTSVIF
jgi:hypothetical protein